MPLWIEETFPLITRAGYSITSEPTDEYNCIAWIFQDTTRWWSHLEGYYWPGPRTPTVQSLVTVFASLGYEVCGDGDVEEGYDKVALYALNERWTHAARQLSDGRWTSKLGPDEDIEHGTLDGLSGDAYGQMRYFMRRKR